MLRITSLLFVVAVVATASALDDGTNLRYKNNLTKGGEKPIIVQNISEAMGSSKVLDNDIENKEKKCFIVFATKLPKSLRGRHAPVREST